MGRDTIDFTQLLQLIPTQDIEGARSGSTSTKIYADVQAMVISVLPYGSYKIIESSLAAYYDVSRSSTKDVLLRLEGRGFINRGPTGKWQVEQLTQRQLSNVYEVRCLLEPQALLKSAGTLTHEFLEDCIRRLDKAEVTSVTLPAGDIDELEQDLHERCLAACMNDLITGFLSHVRSVQITGTHLPDQSVEPARRNSYLREHRRNYEALLEGAPERASEALKLHLNLSYNRATNW